MKARPVDDRLRVRLDVGHRVFLGIDGVADDHGHLRADRGRHRHRRADRRKIVLPDLQQEWKGRRGNGDLLRLGNSAGAERAFFRRAPRRRRRGRKLAEQKRRKRSFHLTRFDWPQTPQPEPKLPDQKGTMFFNPSSGAKTPAAELSALQQAAADAGLEVVRVTRELDCSALIRQRMRDGLRRTLRRRRRRRDHQHGHPAARQHRRDPRRHSDRYLQPFRQGPRHSPRLARRRWRSRSQGRRARSTPLASTTASSSTTSRWASIPSSSRVARRKGATTRAGKRVSTPHCDAAEISARRRHARDRASSGSRPHARADDLEQLLRPLAARHRSAAKLWKEDASQSTGFRICHASH